MLLVVGLIGLSIWLVKVIQNVNGPYLEYGEGFIVYLARLFGMDQWQYNLQGPPYQVSFYTPLYFWIMGKLGGTLFIGRLIDVICAAGSMIFVFLIVYNMTKNKLIALIGALIPATQYIFIQWSLILKTDLMALIFELAGIYIALRCWRSKWLYLSILFFALSFYSKQSFIAGALAVAVVLFIENRRRGLTFSSLTALSIGVPLGVLTFLTQGEFFRQIFTYLQTSPAFTGIWNYLQWLVLDYWTILPALIAGLYYIFNRPTHLLSVYALTAILMSFISIARPGSSQIYMFEPIFSLAIIGSIGVMEIIKKRQAIYIALMVVIPLVALFSNNLVYFSTPEYRADLIEAESIIADADYPILTENPGMVLNADKTPYLCDPFVFMNLASLGIWDETPLLNDLNSKRIPYVITQTAIPQDKIRRLSWPVQEAIHVNYHIVFDKSKYQSGFIIYKANE